MPQQEQIAQTGVKWLSITPFPTYNFQIAHQVPIVLGVLIVLQQVNAPPIHAVLTLNLLKYVVLFPVYILQE